MRRLGDVGVFFELMRLRLRACGIPEIPAANTNAPQKQGYAITFHFLCSL